MRVVLYFSLLLLAAVFVTESTAISAKALRKPQRFNSELLANQNSTIKVATNQTVKASNVTTAPPPPPQNVTNASKSNNATGNATKNIATQPPKKQSTGTLINKYGGFCGIKTKQCVAFCAKPNGDVMDDDFNNFFCYSSDAQAGDTFKCKGDEDCVDELSQKAKGKWCAGVQECKVSTIRKM